MRESPAAVARARWAVAAVFLLNGTLIGTWAAHIPLIAERLQISHSSVGAALLMMALGALIAMPLTGPVIARFGSALVTRVATPTLLVAFPLALLAPRFDLLLPAVFCFGAANGVMDVAMNAHGVTVERRYGRPVMSSFHGMWSLGGLAGAGLAAALLTVMTPGAEALLVVGLVFAAAIAALSQLLPTHTDGGNVGTSLALPNRATLGIGLLCFLCMTAEGAVLDWGALHLRTSLGADPALAATGFATFSAAMAAGRLLGDRLRGHFGAVPLVRWSAALAAVGLAIAILAPWPLASISAFALVGLGIANLVPVFFGAAGQIPGQTPGAAIAALATIGYSGFVVGPPFIGIVADATSLRFALGLMVVACVAIALAANIVEPRGKPAPTAAK
jgi:MFS family permease